MGGIIDERQGEQKVRRESTKGRQKIANCEKGGQKSGRRAGDREGRKVGKKEIGAFQGGVLRRIYSRCSPFCVPLITICAPSDVRRIHCAADVRAAVASRCIANRTGLCGFI